MPDLRRRASKIFDAEKNNILEFIKDGFSAVEISNHYQFSSNFLRKKVSQEFPPSIVEMLRDNGLRRMKRTAGIRTIH
jgi:hypothetical protein